MSYNLGHSALQGVLPKPTVAGSRPVVRSHKGSEIRAFLLCRPGAASADLIVERMSERSVWEPARYDIGDVAALERRFPVRAE
jgi:hypothetical protein